MADEPWGELGRTGTGGGIEEWLAEIQREMLAIKVLFKAMNRSLRSIVKTAEASAGVEHPTKWLPPPPPLPPYPQVDPGGWTAGEYSAGGDGYSMISWVDNVGVVQRMSGGTTPEDR